jgi:glucan phosphorylase
MPANPQPPAPPRSLQAFSGDELSFYQQYLIFQQGIEPDKATPRQRFEALAHVVRHVLMPRWLHTQQTHDRLNPKQVYYLSMEFLIGRSLADIVARFRRRGNAWHALPDKVAIQLNDTHPGLAIAELMRILLDQARLIFGDYFSRREPGIFTPIREFLLDQGDYYMHLADLASYAQAQAQAGRLYADKEAWSKKAILNVAYSGKFSSDRAIQEYAASVWNVPPCPLPPSLPASRAARRDIPDAALRNGGE